MRTTRLDDRTNELAKHRGASTDERGEQGHDGLRHAMTLGTTARRGSRPSEPTDAEAANGCAIARCLV